ncbi:MAG TPA: hypothetical protein VFS40_13700, partial [Gemmatimonadales bacterium]|nr:hypothetical protein [Gemmatimonadales bacterium]
TSSSTKLTLDSNKPTVEGPHTMYVAFQVRNTTGATLTNLTATISGFTADIFLAGSQPAAQAIGSLAPGATRTLYWYIGYVSVIGRSATLRVDVADATPGSAAGSQTFTTTSMISSGTGGTLQSQVINATPVIGGLTSIDVGFLFAGADVGTEYNLQPAGTIDFDARCFQLVRSEVVASSVPAVPLGTTYQEHFVATASQSGGGSGFPVQMRYTFRAMCLGASTTAHPYASQTSGQSLKYSSNFDTFAAIPYQPTANPFAVAKTVSTTALAAAARVTYSVTVTNTSTAAATLDSIADVLPAGVPYRGLAPGSAVTAANSSAVPAAGATGRIVWRAQPDLTWSIAPGATLTLVYTADIPAVDGTYTNAVTAFAGYSMVGTGAVSVVVKRIFGATVTPDGLTVDRLPSNGVRYPQTFTLVNTGSVADTFDLAVTRAPGTAVTIDSVGAQAGASAFVVVDSGQTATVRVVYSVLNVAAATTDKLTLTATSRGDAAKQETGDLTVRVIAAALTLTKQAYRDDGTTLLTPTDLVLPGDYVRFKVTITNTGAAPAVASRITDALPAAMAYASASGDASGWTIAESGGTVTADLTTSLAAGASRYLWIRARIR